MKRIAKPRRGPAPAPAKQVASFVAKFDPQVGKVVRSCRSALRAWLPTARELVYDNYNFLAIGYSPSERTSDTIVSLAAAKSGVALSFYRGASLPDPDRILLGCGSQNRFVRLEGAATLSRPEVQALLRCAIEQSKSPLPSSGRGKTIIKSVSSKQRPRR
jgi:hypothetical protein